MSPSDDLTAALGRVRDLSTCYKRGDADSFDAFRDLVSFLLHATVGHPTSGVRLTFGRRDEPILGGMNGPSDPVRLGNGEYLRLAMTLYREQTPDGPRVKVRASSVQHQQDVDGARWTFRYDYLRHPPEPVPACHLQVRGMLTETIEGPLERVHFPAHRVSLEAVIRLLIEEFRVPTCRDAAGKQADGEHQDMSVTSTRNCLMMRRRPAPNAARISTSR